MSARLLWISVAVVVLAVGSMIVLGRSKETVETVAEPEPPSDVERAAAASLPDPVAPVSEYELSSGASPETLPLVSAGTPFAEGSISPSAAGGAISPSAAGDVESPPSNPAAGGSDLTSLLATLGGAGGAASLSPPTGQAPGQVGEDQMTQAFDMLSKMLGLPEVTPEALKRRVEEVGGLRFKRDVPIDFMTRESLGRYIHDLFEDEYSVDTAEREERVLRAFGFLATGQDLRTIRERVLNENIAGFYDERANVKKLFAISSGKSLNLMNQLVLAHELRHAIQDQNFNLSEALTVKSDYDDRRVAALSLIEGDATLLMETYMMGSAPGLDGLMGQLGGGSGGGGMDASMAEMFAGPALREAPPIVKEQLVSPYMAGRELAHAIHERGGFKLLNEKLKTPPRSMEQVLHPEKYLDRSDEPVPVTAPASSASIESQGRLGELFIRVLLAGDAAETAAAGWGGDDFKLWREDNGAYRLSWKTVWDTDRDAQEFFAALSAQARSRFGSGSMTPALFTVKNGEGVTTSAKLAGKEVLFERAGLN